MQKKRLHNTKNHHYYVRRQRNTKYRQKGEIKNLWKNPKK
jgi:hypothetical protein